MPSLTTPESTNLPYIILYLMEGCMVAEYTLHVDWFVLLVGNIHWRSAYVAGENCGRCFACSLKNGKWEHVINLNRWQSTTLLGSLL
jgi:hypothetical protein